MNTIVEGVPEPMWKVQQTAQLLRQDLRELHNWASLNNPCAEILCLDLLDKMAELKSRMNRIEVALQEAEP